MGDPTYTVFAADTFLYFVNLVPLARNNAGASLTAIRLRFENTDLLRETAARDWDRASP